ncbi:MAG: hypothetical protein RL338_653 [Chloroflexota bacterium]
MTRDELILRTRQLVDEGERLLRAPNLGALQVWLQRSDDLLATAWGSMDRYHLAWLNVGRPRGVRGRPLAAAEEAAYVRDVATQKTAVLRTSLDAVERQGMPFVGEDRAARPGGDGVDGADGDPGRPDRPAPPPRRGPSDPELARRLAEARAEADRHRDHGVRRAPRPERMER